MKKLLVGAIALALTSGIAIAQDLLPLKIGAAGAVDHAPVFVGVERGIFAEHGLDAEVVMYQSGVDMVNGLLNGAQEVNVMGSVPYLSGLARGFPLVLIGHLHGDPNRDAYSDNQSIIASAGSGIGEGDIDALKGKRIGLPRGTGAEGFLLGVLGAAGVGEGDVELINVPPAELVTALNQGDVDAVAIWQPWGATAVTQVEGAVLVQAGGCPPTIPRRSNVSWQPLRNLSHGFAPTMMRQLRSTCAGFRALNLRRWHWRLAACPLIHAFRPTPPRCTKPRRCRS